MGIVWGSSNGRQPCSASIWGALSPSENKGDEGDCVTRESSRQPSMQANGKGAREKKTEV